MRANGTTNQSEIHFLPIYSAPVLVMFQHCTAAYNWTICLISLDVHVPIKSFNFTHFSSAGIAIP